MQTHFGNCASDVYFGCIHLHCMHKAHAMCRPNRNTERPAAGQWCSFASTADITAKAAVDVHPLLSQERDWTSWQ